MQQLNAFQIEVVVAHDRVAARVQPERGQPADISRRIGSGNDIAAGAVGVEAVENSEVAVRVVVVTDDGEPARVQHQRRVVANVPHRVGGGDALVATRAVGVVAVEDLQGALPGSRVGVQLALVTDYWIAVRVERQ